MIKSQFIATTLKGFEDILEKEIKALGGEKIIKLRRAISFSGSLALMYKMNFSLRTALRILYQIRTFRLNKDNELYSSVYKIEWENYIGENKTIAVKAVVNSQMYTNSHFVALKVKDAIVDRMRDKTGARPDVDAKNPDIPIHIHIDRNILKVSLDSTGEPLFKRGYRVRSLEAPLNEVLAAGMIMMTGWKGDADFIDPMCGSGTIAIEAAMIAKGIPPGVFRKSYAFQNWLDYDEELYSRLIEGLMVSRPFNYKIYASDISVKAVQVTRKNIETALLEDIIDISVMDFFDRKPVNEQGVLLMNPPYGERIKQDRINIFYEKIGNHLKKYYTGFDAWILSSNFEAIKKIGLKPSRKIDLLNGNLECKYLKFELFRGKRSDFLKTENG
ncbi:MAG: THUMP domain-containing class I SAM-dependent RNA methyltransferase [Bacteroidota bacterium]